MSVFVVSLEYKPGSEKNREDLLSAHRAWVANLQERGHVVGAGPIVGAPAAVIIADFDSEEDLVADFDTDPFWKAGVVGSRTISQWAPRWAPAQS